MAIESYATRDNLIKIKQSAIERRLNKANSKARTAAIAKSKKTKKPVDYKTQAIKSGSGFTPSDYGVGNGAAIPYQLKTTTASSNKLPIKPRPVPSGGSWKPPVAPSTRGG